MTLGQRIQELRKQHNLSQEGLGEKLGVSRQAVSRWEMDGAVPEVDKLVAMSRVFGVSLNDLLQVAGSEHGGESRIVLPPARPWRVGVLVLALACALSLGGNVWLGLRNGELEERLAAVEQELDQARNALDPGLPLVTGFDMDYYLVQRDELLVCYTFTLAVAQQAEGMEVELQVMNGDGTVYVQSAELAEGAVYQGELEAAYPADGNATVSAVFRDALGRAYTQPLVELSEMGAVSWQERPLWDSY